MRRPTREELIALAKTDPEAIADLVLRLWDRVVALEKLETRIAGLERNSRSSSKPPSTDKGNFTNPPKPKSLRTKSGKKPGGQKGHPGSTLEKTPNPDHIELHRFLPDELFDCPISPGTLAHIVKSGGEKAAIAMAPIREALVAGPVLHADETGCTLHGKRHWLHVLSNDRLTCYHRLLRQGYRAKPEPPPKAQGLKGRVKRRKSLNLPDWLGKRWPPGNIPARSGK